MAGNIAFNEQILASLRPNFFELVAQEAMHEALRPAFEYICKVLVSSRPDIFEYLWKSCDELFLLLDSLVQLYFIQKHGGSCSENFYSLERVLCQKRTELLGAREKQLSLFCLAVVPYLKIKMDRLYNRLLEENDTAAISYRHGNDNTSTLFKLIFFKTYPYIHFLLNGTKFIFRTRYLFGLSDIYSPLLWLSGVTLSRQLETKMLADGNTPPQSSESWWRRFVNILLPLSVFGLKLLEWWYSNEKSAVVKMVTSLPIPPPPKPIEPSAQGLRPPMNPQLCPICLQQRVNPTTISSSGYVFCYICILGYLKSHRQCPVTCVPTNEKQLVRLFIQQQTT